MPQMKGVFSEKITRSPWPSLLGRAPDARLLILHADDVGMCEASVSAFQDLTDAGTISSGSVMVPCPWFPAVAQYCSKHTNADLGAHLTLTSEWRNYRWGPVSQSGLLGGLTDAAGYFHADRAGLNRSATPDAVEAEMRAQIERALAAGIDLTHIDAHMFACLSPRYIQSYAGLAREFQLPALLWSWAWEDILFPSEDMENAPPIFERLRSSGFLPIDQVVILDSTRPAERAEQIRSAISELRAGVTHLLVHPSTDSPELRAISPAGWPNRVADYEALLDPHLPAYIRGAGVELIGYRDLRTALHAR